jgi:hypothetical protein
MPATVQEVFPFGHEELHVIEYGRPNQPITLVNKDFGP